MINDKNNIPMWIKIVPFLWMFSAIKEIHENRKVNTIMDGKSMIIRALGLINNIEWLKRKKTRVVNRWPRLKQMMHDQTVRKMKF